MDHDRHIWRCWASNLQRWGVSVWTAAFLEAAGSLSVLGAQVVYFSQPLISWMVSEEQMTSLARLLEDSSNRQIFVGYLREVDVL